MRHHGKILVGDAEHPIHQIAPGGHKLVIVAAQKFGPGKVRVLCLGAGGGKVIAQGVRIVTLQKIVHVNHHPAAAAEFFPFHREKFAGNHIVGNGEGLGFPAAQGARHSIAITNEHAGPDNRVKYDVVLTHKIIVGGMLILPPFPPGIGTPHMSRPLHTGR